jgi:hypothetical protein
MLPQKMEMRLTSIVQLIKFNIKSINMASNDLIDVRLQGEEGLHEPDTVPILYSTVVASCLFICAMGASDRRDAGGSPGEM